MIASTAATFSPPPTPLAVTVAVENLLSDRRVAFTTPPVYATRLASLLHLRAATPVPIPTVTVEPTPRTIASLRPFFFNQSLDCFSSLLFTSRTGITAVDLALAVADAPTPLADLGEPFIVSALGRDVDLLHEIGLIHKLCRNPNRIRVLTPEVASPLGLVEVIGEGFGRRALCPVPDVVDLEEPSVVPEFLKGLTTGGWVPVRVAAYETRWAGLRCVEELLGGKYGDLDAIVFTSTAEVEGLVKALEVLGWCWSAFRKNWPEMLVAAHGPVTAKGAERFGIVVDVVSSSYSSFDGVLDALALSSYALKLHALIVDIAAKLAESLGLVGYSFQDWPCQFRLNKYNFTNETVGSPGVQIHTDSGFLTVLQEDESVGGLEIMDSTGNFVAVDPVPGTFLVNLGDIAKVWSNGRLHNVKHRVQCKEVQPRISIALFLLAPKDDKVEPQQELIDSEHPRLYQTFTFEEYRRLRLSPNASAGEALSRLAIDHDTDGLI